MDPQQKIVCIALYIVMVIIFIAVLLSPNDRFNIWTSCKLDQFIDKRKAKRQAKDEADPGRVIRRERRKAIKKAVNMYIYFLSILVILPVGGIGLTIWQYHAGNEAWPLILLPALQGSLGVWAIIIKAALQEKRKAEQGNSKI